MIPKEFAYSDQALYPHWSAFKVKTVNIIDQNIVVTSDGKSFQVSFPDVSEKYILPYVKSDAVVQRWRTDWFVCVEVLRPSQPNGVMSSAVSLPNHTFTGQA